jgi:uncharacterized protein YbcI
VRDDLAGPPGAAAALMLEISNAIGSLHLDFFGCDPTRSRAYLEGDLLVVILEGALSEGEKLLEARGRGQTVVDTRLAMQAVIEAHWTSAVELLLQRPVTAFMSATNPGSDTQAEIFLLGSPADAA